MDAVLSIEIEMESLRVALKQQIFKVEYAQTHFDQFSLLDERRLKVVENVHASQSKMAYAFRKSSPGNFRKTILC